ncbi:hypothetical protein NQ315_005073 [Exocentrus adspersus]|uniref:Neurotransmitter-gated ion-channel ligand-binding domain-containing protein n=1 Tax=Exocentrus adspersus TaxID=1586481 RepID=A0AAV8VQQ3_9CUCU|nr:hypothetical protein NQ315_005073 [Exocentrus adspersus]
MKNKTFVDCLMLMGTALSMKSGLKLPEMDRPLLEDVFTTLVNLSVTIEEFKVYDTKNMLFVVDGLLTQRWIDQRLGANVRTRKMAIAGQVWKPIIINLNGYNKITNKDDTVFWRGFGEEGNVLLSEKFNIESTCTTDFHEFPFDRQVCQIKFGTYRFPVEEVIIEWENIGIYLLSQMRSNEFHLINVSTYTDIDIRVSGNFSAAVVQLTLQRKSIHYLICTGIPCMTVIILNYISLWFSVVALPYHAGDNFLCGSKSTNKPAIEEIAPNTPMVPGDNFTCPNALHLDLTIGQ